MPSPCAEPNRRWTFASPIVAGKLNRKNPPDRMKARILGLMGCLVLVGCEEAQVSSDESPTRMPDAKPSPGPLYLTQRVVLATEESLWGVDAGTELKLIEELPTGLLVEAEGMRFEIDPRQTTRDRELAETLLDHAKESKAAGQGTTEERWRIEDRRFLAEEDLRGSAAREAHLRNPVDPTR